MKKYMVTGLEFLVKHKGESQKVTTHSRSSSKDLTE